MSLVGARLGGYRQRVLDGVCQMSSGFAAIREMAGAKPHRSVVRNRRKPRRVGQPGQSPRVTENRVSSSPYYSNYCDTVKVHAVPEPGPCWAEPPIEHVPAKHMQVLKQGQPFT
jgi:hypothetical protein